MRPATRAGALALAALISMTAGAAGADEDPLPAGATLRLGSPRWRVGEGGYRAAFSRDARTFAVANGVTISLWDATTGKGGPKLVGHIADPDPDHAVMCVAFSADGRAAASGAYDQTIRLWDVATGKQTRVISGFVCPIWEVAFSPDGRFLASAESFSGDQTDSARALSKSAKVRVWEVATGREVAQIHGSDACASGSPGLLYSPDGKTLAIAIEREVHLLDAATLERRGKLKAGATVEAIAFAPGGGRAAVTSGGGSVAIFDLATGKATETVTVAGGAWIYAPTFSPDGKSLALLSASEGVLLHAPGSGKPPRLLVGNESHLDWALAFTPDGGTLVASVGGNLRLFDVATGKQKNTAGHGKAVISVAFLPDGKTIATGCEDDAVRLWDAATGRELAQLRVPGAALSGVAVAPGGKSIVTFQSYFAPSSPDDRGVRVWDPATGKELRRLAGNRNAVGSIAFSRDGATIVGGGTSDDGVLVWEAASGKLLRSLRAPGEGYAAVAVSPDGKAIAAAGTAWIEATSDSAYAIRLWDATTGKELRAIPLADGAQSLAFSPDGKRLASGSMSKTTVWDPATGARLYDTDDYGSAAALAFSPDGAVLAAGYQDAVRLRDAATGAERRRISGHTEDIRALAFSPDGRTLATGSTDRTVLLWDLAAPPAPASK